MHIAAPGAAGQRIGTERRETLAFLRIAVLVVFRAVVLAEIGPRLVVDVGDVGEDDELVEPQPVFQEIFDLLVVERRRVREDAGVEELDPAGRLQAGRVEPAR
jgi:hypothetical protein